jgi:type IV pilus assembly protein PilB
VLYFAGSITKEAFEPIIARIKVMAKLDPSEKRKVQEGGFTVESPRGHINLRVEIVQTIYGELVIIRVHKMQTIVMELAWLGMNKQDFETYNNMLRRMSGLLLVSGPTGSGKTTTLYSTISYLNKDDRYNVMTIEDPVEFQLNGVNQMQANPENNFGFVEGLKSILRLSPDIILVGEVRDRETSEIAVTSGLTGQLVLSTLHAVDSVGSLFRLLDLGIEPYLINSALAGVVSQRLVRVNCQECLEAYQPSEDENAIYKQVLGRPPKSLMRSKGCPACQNLMFKGRTGIYEVLPIGSGIRGLLRGKVDEESMRQGLIKQGFTTLMHDGLIKAEQGVTTLPEVLRNSMRVD